MSHMEKQIEYGRWIEVETLSGTFFLDFEPVGSELLQFLDVTNEDLIESIQTIRGWGARFSAPGYMDCTEWVVFATKKEAEDYLDEFTKGD